MIIKTTKHFARSYSKLPLATQKKADKCIQLFIQDRNHPSLKDHALRGKLKGSRSFSVDKSIRIRYTILNNGEVVFLFIDIGTHEQVY